MSFDTIQVTGESPPPNMYSIEGYLQLPVHIRVRDMLQHRVQFFLGANPVESRIALRELRLMSASGATA